MRKIKREDLIGKTITDVFTHCDNVIHLTFSDSNHYSIWAEVEGNIPVLLTNNTGQYIIPEEGQ